MALAVSPARADGVAVNLAGVSEALFKIPHDMTLTPDGRYLVLADMGNDRVVFLDPDTLSVLSVLGEGVMSFPHDVTFAKDGRMLVADSGNDRILVYRYDGGLKPTLSETWPDLPSAEGVAVAPDGRAYVSLANSNRVVRLKDGKVEMSVDQALGATLDRPHDIEVATTGGQLSVIVADAGNHRLIVFDLELRPLYEISTWNPPLSEPKYFGVGAKGRVFIADQYNNKVRVFSSSSEPLGELGEGMVKLPEGVLMRDQRIWISDTEGGRVILYHLDQSR